MQMLFSRRLLKIKFSFLPQCFHLYSGNRLSFIEIFHEFVKMFRLLHLGCLWVRVIPPTPVVYIYIPASIVLYTDVLILYFIPPTMKW